MLLCCGREVRRARFRQLCPFELLVCGGSICLQSSLLHKRYILALNPGSPDQLGGMSTYLLTRSDLTLRIIFSGPASVATFVKMFACDPWVSWRVFDHRRTNSTRFMEFVIPVGYSISILVPLHLLKYSPEAARRVVFSVWIVVVRFAGDVGEMVSGLSINLNSYLTP